MEFITFLINAARIIFYITMICVAIDFLFNKRSEKIRNLEFNNKILHDEIKNLRKELNLEPSKNLNNS